MKDKLIHKLKELVGRKCQHKSTCYLNQNWVEALDAMNDTPMRFRDEGWHEAMAEINVKMRTCSCGLVELCEEIAALENQIEQDKLAEKIANTDYMDTEKPVYDENYLNDCIKRAKPNLSKIKDVDKHLDEIRGIEPKKVIDDEQYVDRSISIDQYIDANPELDDITTHKEIDESNE